MPLFKKKDTTEGLRQNTSMESFGFSNGNSTQIQEEYYSNQEYEAGRMLPPVLEDSRLERSVGLSGGIMAASYESIPAHHQQLLFQTGSQPVMAQKPVQPLNNFYTEAHGNPQVPSNNPYNPMPRHPVVPPNVRPVMRSTPNHLFRLNDFDLIKTLGTGTFGRVYLAVYKGTKKYFAMKVMKKAEVVRLRQVEHIYSEKFLLSNIRFPFIIHL